jgi:lysozyme
MRAITIVSLLFVIACAPTEIAVEEQAATVCAAGATIKGIDVAYHEGNINWATVKNAGYHFAFIRVSDGANFQDPKFATNWNAAKQAGVVRGAYQFFRPSQSVTAQANLLLSMMGPLEPGDLPPVIDVEDTGGLSPATVAQKVAQWISIVEPAIGRKPIIYAGKYFWQDNVASAAFASYPLWHAQYTTASCPNIANQWSDWAFWQYTDAGNVPGIPDDLTDLNYFNGSLQDLLDFANGDNATPPPQCQTIPADGAIINEDDDCFTAGGPSQYLRSVSGEGYNNDLLWTNSTTSANESNFARWNLSFAQSGLYNVEVYIDTTFAQTKKARYTLRHNGFTDAVTLNQSSTNGWRTLGQFEFAAGEGQYLHLGDNTGESGLKITFDAVRITPVEQIPCGFVSSLLILDEEEDCVIGGGPMQYFHAVSGEGFNNGLVYTGTTASASVYNYVQWNLTFAQSGTYKVEVYTDTTYARSKQAKYKIRHNGSTHSVTLNQSSANGWRNLGNFTFAAGTNQYIYLGDNTGESSSQNIKIAFDAIKITRITNAGLVDDGLTDEELEAGEGGTVVGGCAVSQDESAASLLPLALLALLLYRRRALR